MNKQDFGQTIISKKTQIILFMLILIFSFSLVACNKDNTDEEDQIVDGNDQSQIEDVGEVEQLESKLESQITPIDSISQVTDPEIVDSILQDKVEIGELEKSSDHTEVQLITKHAGEIISVPVQYPFANWLAEQEKPVLFECIADYSQPAEDSLPYLYGIAEQYDNELIVCKVDITDSQDFIDLFHIEYLPTYFLSRDSTLYQIATGFDPYANPSLVDNIEQLLTD